MKISHALNYVGELHKLNIHNMRIAKHEKQDIKNCFEKRFEVFLATYTETLEKPNILVCLVFVAKYTLRIYQKTHFLRLIYIIVLNLSLPPPPNSDHLPWLSF